MVSHPDIPRQQVKLFALLTCSHCKDTKRFLQDHGVPYTLVQVDMLLGEERRQALDELKQANPLCSFPTLILGDQVIVGFNKDLIKKALASE
jgi:glutaredoxin-like protein NrdH